MYNGGECLSVDIAVIFADMSAIVCECFYDKIYVVVTSGDLVILRVSFLNSGLV